MTVLFRKSLATFIIGGAIAFTSSSGRISASAENTAESANSDKSAFVMPAPKQDLVERCTSVPANDPTAIVRVCESLTHYIFTIADHVESFDRKEYQKKLILLTEQWLTANGLDKSLLAQARVEIWMSVPEVNSAGAKVRAFVQTTYGNFVISLPVSPEEWKVSSANIGITEEEHYPQAYGYRAGSLLIKKIANASEQAFLEKVDQYSESPAEKFSPQWYSITTSIFSERPVSVALQQDGASVVEAVNFNQVMEWMAWRERVFAFSVQSNP